MIKNQPDQRWRLFAFNRITSDPVTGDAANITAKLEKDYTGLQPTVAAPVEIEDGYYYVPLTQAETDANVLSLIARSSTPDVQVIGVPGEIHTYPANFANINIDADGHFVLRPVDGLTEVQFRQVLSAFMLGENSVTENEDATERTTTFYNSQGQAVLALTYRPRDGLRFSVTPFPPDSDSESDSGS